MIFISYRKADTQAVVDNLAKELKKHFGEGHVFKDDQDIRAGDRWPQRLQEAVLRSTVLLAVVGKDWLTIHDDFGRRRIDDEDDWVRLEICTALANQKRVIVLLVDSAPFPSKLGLPSDCLLQTLPELQHLPLRLGRDFDTDLATLVRELTALVPPEQNFRPPIRSFAAYIEEKTRGFVGRGWIFEEIDRHLQDREEFPSGYVLITGEPGIGKTALVAQLVKTRGYVHHFNIALEGIRSPKHFLVNVCSQLILRYRLPHKKLPEDAHENGLFLSRLLEEASEKEGKARPLVLVIDALDEAERAGGANPLFLPPALPDQVYVVVTTRPGDEYRLTAMHVRDLALDGRSEDNCRDVRAHIEASLPRVGIQAWMRDRSLEPAEFTEVLLDKSQGNFMYLFHILPAIEAGEFHEFGLEDLPRGLRDYYRRHWEMMRRRARNLFNQVYEPVVCILGAVREAVSEEQVAEWTELEQRQVHRVIHDWREFLYEERGRERQHLYRIYHTTFQDYLQEEVDPGLKTYHAMIARSALRKVGKWKDRKA